MSCCRGDGTIDPKSNKPIVTVNNTVDGIAPSSAGDAAAAFATQDAAQRLPPFFFTKMPDEEPVASKDLIPAGVANGMAAGNVDVGNKDQDGLIKQGNNGPQISTPGKSVPKSQAYNGSAGGVIPTEQPGALPALLQVVEVKGADGQMTYHVVEATPPPPMQVAS